MRILVTGHLGYIGSVLTQRLLQRDHQVTGMDWLSDGESEHTIPVLDGDIRDIAPDALQGFDAVIHLAALPADSEDQRAPQKSLEVNHLACARLAVLAKVAGVRRFVFASASPELRGGTSGYHEQESSPRPPVPFDIAKGRAEIDLARLNSDDFKVVSLRIPSAYGHSPSMRDDLVINALVDEARSSGELGFSENANDLHRPIHIDDVVRGFEQALDLPGEDLTKAVYDLGACITPIKRGELVRLVAECVGGTQVHLIPSIPRAIAPNRKRVQPSPNGLPGFRTLTNLNEGITSLVAGSE